MKRKDKRKKEGEDHKKRLKIKKKRVNDYDGDNGDDS